MTRIGWCPGDRTVAAMLAMYPGTTVVRVFVGAGKPLPAWDGPVLGPAVTAGAVVHVSFKTWDLPAVLAWAAKKPAGVWLLLTYAHEPEQQQYGDPTVQQFHARWAEMVPAFVGHPMRDEILLGPVYTRYWWQKFAGDLRWLLTVPVDFIGWDVYNNGTSYRSPEDLLSIPRQIAARTGLPYLIAELGAVRVPGDDTGTGRSTWMRSMVAAAKDDGALTACWFHRTDCDLVPWPPEQQTWQDITRQETLVTTAPETLKAARQVLLDHLPIDAAALGIVGDAAHRGGYHCGADRVVSGDYSVVESSRDRAGLAEWACALDVGSFTVSVAGKSHDLRSFSIWLVAQCKAGSPDTADIREVIYSPDGTTVRRWDRLGKRTSGDDSHRWHTHISYHRDAIKAGRDQTAVFTRYLTSIGLLEEDMTPAQFAEILADPKVASIMRALPWQYTGGGIPAGMSTLGVVNELLTRARAADGTDEQAIIAGVLAGLSPEKIAAAIPADIAGQVADELATRLAE